MSRSLFKGPFMSKGVTKQNKNIQTKNNTILPCHIYKTIHIYTGNTYIPIKIKEGMVGKKFGAFIRTRAIFKYKKKKKQK